MFHFFGIPPKDMGNPRCVLFIIGLGLAQSDTLVGGAEKPTLDERGWKGAIVEIKGRTTLVLRDLARNVIWMFEISRR